MQRFLCFMCGFAEMMAIGSVISLPLPWIVSALLLVTPVVLLVLVLGLPGWQQAARERRSQVYVYVPIEQREYPGQVTRVYQPGETDGYESDGGMW